jgi:hypothetical protein
MATPNSEKPATAETVNGLFFEQLGSELESNNSLLDRQAQRIARVHAVSYIAALTISSLAYGVAR